MLYITNDFQEYKVSGETFPEIVSPEIVNGYQISTPFHYKNKAHHRAYYIALALANKKPLSAHTQRMGDIVISTFSPVILTSSDCIEIIMFDVPTEIELDYNAKNPSKSAREAMEYVPSFFEPNIVIYDHKDKPKKIYFLEIVNPANELVRTSSYIDKKEE